MHSTFHGRWSAYLGKNDDDSVLILDAFQEDSMGVLSDLEVQVMNFDHQILGLA
jgi:hypothetical protein